MRNTIIVGYNQFSKKIIDKLEYVKVILDDLAKDKWYKNIKIDSISNISKYLEDNDEIYVLEDMPYFDEVYHKLFYNGVNKINVIIKENVDRINENVLKSECIQTYYLQNKPLLRYIEMHICDKCNLKCNGCTHFSNIVTCDNVSIEMFKKDIDELEKKFDVSMIRLMGGEPLLKNNLNEYLDYVRYKFPNSTIFLVTNGLLVPNIMKQVVDSIKKNNIIINISLYKTTIKRINKIQKFLDNNQIRCRYGNGNKRIVKSDYITEFHTCLSLNKQKNNKKLICYNQYCWFLRNGKIYKCPYPALINILNNKYKVNFEVDKRDCYNLLEIKDGWKVIKKLSNKSPFCNYCRSKIKKYEWNNDLPKLDYYILGGKNGNIKGK